MTFDEMWADLKSKYPKICITAEQLSDAMEDLDAVCVVRCKDCKHCITHEKVLFCGYMGNIGDWRFRTEIDFCSRGERKEEQTEYHIENDGTYAGG